MDILNLLNNCISDKSAPLILSITGKCTFRFSKFLMIGLCNYLVNSAFSETVPELNPVPLFVLEEYLSRVAKVADCASEAIFLSKNL